MAGVAQGDRIRSQDPTPIERRINAIEAATWVRGAVSANLRGLAVDDDDNIHIDRGGTAIAVYDSDGNPLFQYSVPINYILIGWGGSGHIYVRLGTAIKRYTKLGVLVDSPTLGSNYDLVVPGTSLDGFIYAADASDGGVNADFDVYQLNATGTSVVNSDSFSQTGDGDYAIAHGIGINASNGNIYFWGAYDELDTKVWRFTQTLGSRTDMADPDGAGSDTTGASAASTDEFAVLRTNPGEIDTFDSDGTTNTTITGHGLGNALIRRIATDSSNFLWWTERNSAPAIGKAHKADYNGNNHNSFDVHALSQPISQTTWYKYPTASLGDKVSLGTPDGGVSIPALTAMELVPQRQNEVLDMRNAVEAVAVYWKNAVTGNAFNWTNLSSDNLYHVAVESGQYDWDESAGRGVIVREDLIDELDLCLTKLEESDLV